MHIIFKELNNIKQTLNFPKHIALINFRENSTSNNPDI